MRTTIDLPEDLHRILMSLAAHTRRSLSQTAAELIRLGLGAPHPASAVPPRVEIDPLTGLPVLQSTATLTPDDVRSLDD